MLGGKGLTKQTMADVSTLLHRLSNPIDVRANRPNDPQGPRAFGDKEINATYGELLWATGEVKKNDMR